MNTSEPSQAPVAPLDWPRTRGETKFVRELIDDLQRERRRKRKKLRAGAALVLTLGVLGFWAVPAYRDTATLRTELAHRQSFVLKDGSQVQLNAHTSVKTDFRYGRRTLKMTSGEAFFLVAKDAGHPFVVETPAGEIRVTGTQFNVRLDGQKAELTLVDGSVVFGASSPLRPGEQLSSADGAVVVRTLSATQLSAAVSWRSGTLSLEGFTLGEAVGRFAAYQGVRISVDPAIAQTRIGGEIPLDDLPEFLGSVKDALHVTVRTNPDGSVDILSR